jgi:hypothetical protein
MKHKSAKLDKSTIVSSISKCSKTDFDGHTEFQKLTTKEKILWLSNTVYFLHTVASNNPGIGCKSFFSRRLPEKGVSED